MDVAARPDTRTLERLDRLLEPWRLVVSPVFHGLELIPDTRPLLLVGNHTLMGVLDLPFLFVELYRRKGIFPRSLGDHAHFRVPVWSELLRQVGAVDGTRDNANALMRAGECVVVFPGGAREVAKRRGEKYQLIWKDRLGFARVAIRHGATVVPFAAVGAEDLMEIVVDGNDIKSHLLGRLALKAGILREDFLLPLVKPAPLTRLERFYFQFCPPIATAEFLGDDGDANARLLRDRTRGAVERAIADVQRFRAHDPHRLLASRLGGAGEPGHGG